MSNKSNLPQKSVNDISEINLRNLLIEARDILTAPKPILFKKFGNRQLTEDVKRIGLINEYLENLVKSGQSLVRLNVDAITSMEKIQLLAQTELDQLRSNAKKAKNNLEYEDSSYEFDIKKLQNNIKALDFEIASKRLNLEEQEFELKKREDEHKMSIKEREQALIERERESQQRIKESDQIIKENELDSQNRINIAEASMYLDRMRFHDESKFNKSFITLYNKISQELKMENITPSQTLILISLFSKNPSSKFEDVDANREMILEQLKKMKQDTAYRRAEAKDKRLDNEVKIYKMKKEEIDIDG